MDERAWGKTISNHKRKLGELPIIAEDLGVMTPSVEKLRDQFKFPGMKILQFAFNSDAANSFLSHNYPQNCVVYTGTHDNDTTIGWYRSAPEIEQHRAREYTRSDGSEIHWDLIRYAMLSVADQAIFPLQDFMNLDTSHRMKYPRNRSEKLAVEVYHRDVCRNRQRQNSLFGGNFKPKTPFRTGSN
jgi:4-alpha-glucanotransferase